MKRITRFIIWLVLASFTGSAILFTYWVWTENQLIKQLEIVKAKDIAPGQFILVNDRKIHVVIKGDLHDDPTGTPLLLLHGFSTGGQDTWFPWADSLVADRTIIVPDMLNFGLSDKIARPDHSITHEGQAAYMAGMIEKLGLSQVDLVARSYGGAVGSQLILDYPGRIRRVAYVGAHVYWNEDSNVGAQIGKALGRLPLGIGRAFIWNSMGGGDGGFAGRDCLREGINCQRFQITRTRGTVDGMRALSLTEQVSRIPRDINKIQIPASVFWGGEDPIVPLENGERLAKELNVELHVTPGAGHWPFETDPVGFRKDILAFFAKNTDESN